MLQYVLPIWNCLPLSIASVRSDTNLSHVSFFPLIARNSCLQGRGEVSVSSAKLLKGFGAKVALRIDANVMKKISYS
jgi:hypothetical protein